ncbi:S9 family peptidase [Paenibacillus cymbidii]|uniref:S9 family peptidase n=1 Tax=Paenibacillus cymbidii TaxID=1639034 RepID=UPI00143680A4|nr:dienelactone hydrolase family protein [Paenibacillus cymbidii]
MSESSHLAGTEPFTAEERRRNPVFADRYAKQWAMSLQWLRGELDRVALARDAVRRRDAAWLDAKRLALAAMTGFDRFAGAAADTRRLAVAEGEGWTAAAYEVATAGGLRYAATLYRPRRRPAAGAVLLAGEDIGELDRARSAYLAQGFAVIRPQLAGTGFSFRGHPQRQWFAYPDHELLHNLAFVCGGSLAGMEAAELLAVGDEMARLAGTEAAEVPLIVDCRGRHLLAGAAAAAHRPGRTAAIVLAGDAGRLDRQQDDARSNTVWGFHREFDLLTLLQLAAPGTVIFAEDGPTPSAEAARAAVWFAEERETPDTGTRVVRCAREEKALGAAAQAAVTHWRVRADALPAGSPTEAPLTEPARPEAPGPGGGDALAEVLQAAYAASVANKVDFLERLQAEALREKEDRYDLSALTPDAYRHRVAEALERTMGAVPPPRQARPPRVLTGKAAYSQGGASHDAYEVVLESLPGVETAGYLLLPRSGAVRSGRADAPAGSDSGSAPARLAAVICQHGLMGRPEDALGWSGSGVYYRFASSLADKGYAVFVPFMTWGWGGNPARDALTKHAYALGFAPNRLEAAQLRAIVDFLASRPEIDPARIGFYGLSYGGHASLWLAAEERRLAAVVTAGHFNDWGRKLVSTAIERPGTTPLSFITVDDCLDMFGFDVLRLIGHAELASLAAPRPHMVENGLRDPVTPYAWVASEHARLRRVFAWLGAEDHAEIEHFDGPHRIWGERSFQFLEKHLRP